MKLSGPQSHDNPDSNQEGRWALLNVDNLRFVGFTSFFVLIGLFPRAAPVLLAVFLCWSVIALRGRWAVSLDVLRRAPAICFTAAFLGFAALSAFWSNQPSLVLKQAGLEFLILVALVVVLADISSLRSELRQRFANACVVAVLILCLFFCFELLTDFYFSKKFYALWPELAPKKAGLRWIMSKLESGTVSFKLRSAAFNPNVKILALLIWPAVFLAISANWKKTGLVLSGAILVIGGAVLFMSESETVKLAFAMSCLVVAIVLIFERLALKAAIVVWCALVLLIVPLSASLFSLGLHEAPWVQESAQARINIWHRIGKETHVRPILGHGMRSLRSAETERVSKIKGRKVARYKKERGPGGERVRNFPKQRMHPHNQYLQVWYELGAIGAILLAAIGVAVILSMRTLGTVPRAMTMGAFSMVAVIALAANDLWHEWLHAGLAWTVIAFWLAPRSCPEV